MASKPETTFYQSVHRYLAPTVYREKMYNPLRGGTWDFWFSGRKHDLWVEYKFIALPKRETTLIQPGLSELQLAWGRGRYNEGRNLAVIIGSKDGGVVLDHLEWEQPLSVKQFREKLKARAEIAKWIQSFTEDS